MKQSTKMQFVKFTVALTITFCTQDYFAQNTFPSSGNVGIGTTTPVKELHVNGKMFVDNSGGGFLGHFRSLGTGWAEMVVENRSGAVGNSTVYGHIKVEGGQVEIGSRSAHPVHIGAGDNKSHLNIMTNGKVGIGTTNPSSTLDVNGTVKVGGTPWTQIQLVDRDFSGSHALLFNAVASSSYVAGGLSTTGNTKFANDVGLYQGGAGGVFFEGNGGIMTFRVSGESTGKNSNVDWGAAPEMVIRRGGNVGIGTGSPTEKLSVNGGILCEKVRVIQDVPNSDHVFEDDYKLLTIDEVKSFVKENKHLPEVPSAKEFKENGYLVGEMDDLLLRKVEELTLYIIDLKEEMNGLNKELETLKESK